MSVAITVGLLTAAAVYLFMQRGMVRIVLGFVLISHAGNLLLFSAGNTAFRDMPYVGSGEAGQQADPLPQAFVLTAIVIAFSITMFMVTLAITTTGDDDTEDQERSPANVLVTPPDEDADPAAAAAPGQKLTTADTADSIGQRIDTAVTGAQSADTGGAKASPRGAFSAPEGPSSTERGGRT
ncbi:sodium:proton antiporter [Garicola koreensis]|uniref:Multisubunit Na+/H+ antiporter MnhC subunit n=1 Tax=Garicola koreensis TaxID=1262554 RepID=A0A7W5TVM6_9MICC|nr:cation:proton antiporter subunit C [Garicola koreensis]MBB3667689.1 multisubunit Na+/H+ antiporter MnhC subunit [Garicola koreensis]